MNNPIFLTIELSSTDQFCFLINGYTDTIDLAEESGVVKNMNERPSEQFASEYLEFRRTYILVDVKRECATLNKETLIRNVFPSLLQVYPGFNASSFVL